MTEVNIYLLASRTKLRFPYRGTISHEDLWDLSLTVLDGIFKVLNAQSKAMSEESLLGTKSPADQVLRLQIAIIKDIVAIKIAERDAAAQAKSKAERAQTIMGILAEKDNEALRGKSTDELKAELNALLL